MRYALLMTSVITSCNEMSIISFDLLSMSSADRPTRRRKIEKIGHKRHDSPLSPKQVKQVKFVSNMTRSVIMKSWRNWNSNRRFPPSSSSESMMLPSQSRSMLADKRDCTSSTITRENQINIVIMTITLNSKMTIFRLMKIEFRWTDLMIQFVR